MTKMKLISIITILVLVLAAVNGQVGDYIPDSKNLTGFNIENGLTTATYKINFESMEDVALEGVSINQYILSKIS